MRDNEIWKDLINAATIIDSWTAKQRKMYLARLREREKIEGKTLYRNVLKIMLAENKRRRYFMNFVKTGKHKV